MKKKLLTLILCFSMTYALVVPAYAANYEAAAESLKSVGLFQGTDNGFELDRPATRIEAAVMLVRLLGLENAAKTRYAAKETSHPFKDVPGWADAYIALLYTDGLAKGTSGTTFGTSDCTAQMYCTFLLRALGYSEAAGDFTYDEAVDKAAALGFYNDIYIGGLLGDGSFLRDGVAAVSYLALDTNVKDTEKTLLAVLVDDGVVDAKAAEKLLTLQKNLRDLNALTVSAKNSELSAMDMDMTLVMTVSHETNPADNAAMTADITALFNFEKDNLCASVTYDMLLDGQTEEMQLWYKDGWLYAQIDGQKMKTPYDLNEVMSLANSSDTAQLTVGNQFPVLFVKEITKIADGSYTITLSDAVLAPLYDVVDMLALLAGEELTFDLQVSDMTIQYKKNGLPEKLTFDFSLLLAADGTDIKADVQISTDICTGSKTVNVTFPSNLRDFQTIEGLLPIS